MKDLHDKWQHRWLSPKAEAKNSAIHGLGVFASGLISEGEPVGVLGGVTVHKSEIEEHWEEMGHVGIQIDDDFFVVPTDREELKEKGVFNHSCDPNLGFGSSLTLIAINDIEPGEELTFDYGFNETYHSGFDCECGADTCRGQVTPDDWKQPSLREEYGEYFSPYLQSKIKDEYQLSFS